MAEFHKVAGVADVPPGTGKKVNVQGKSIALFNLGGTFCATQGTCPHRGGPLSEGTLQGGHVTCPWHAWTFDIATGSRVGCADGMGKITTYKVRLEGNDVLVEC